MTKLLCRNFLQVVVCPTFFFPEKSSFFGNTTLSCDMLSFLYYQIVFSKPVSKVGTTRNRSIRRLSDLATINMSDIEVIELINFYEVRSYSNIEWRAIIA